MAPFAVWQFSLPRMVPSGTSRRSPSAMAIVPGMTDETVKTRANDTRATKSDFILIPPLVLDVVVLSQPPVQRPVRLRSLQVAYEGVSREVGVVGDEVARVAGECDEAPVGAHRG